MSSRLGVNIDHVATLRQQRGMKYPSLVQAAEVTLLNGAEQITMHLREDRRHVQDQDMYDVIKITQKHKRLFNFEMGCASEIVDIAINVSPEWVCLVPEKREEKTTEGGLNLLNSENFNRVKLTCEKIKTAIPNTKISLFLEADLKVLERAIELKVDAVEIHTGEFAIDFLNEVNCESHIKNFKEGQKLIKGAGIGYHAGHGLTYESTLLLEEHAIFEEYNIGHSMICEAVFDGLGSVVNKYHQLLNRK